MSEGVSACASRMLEPSTLDVEGVLAPGAKVLVAGATGGVGQLLTKRLVEAGYNVRVACRSKDKAEEIFGCDHPEMEMWEHDLANLEEATQCAEGVDAIFCLVGTTAFPTNRWAAGSTAEMSCDIVPHNLIKAAPKTIKRFVMVTSAGVERYDQFPFSILNSFKVLTYKRKAEQSLIESGLPYTIFRPDRLIDGPWTSTDVNTLFKAETKGSRSGVKLSLKDIFGKGEASRVSVAEALLQCLGVACTNGHAYAITSTREEGPSKDSKKWERMFAMVR